MTDVLNPTDNGLPTESNTKGRNFRYIPPPPTRELAETQRMADNLAVTQEAQVAEQRAFDEFDSTSPIPYQASNWSPNPSGPNLPEMPSDVSQAEQLWGQVQSSMAARQSNTSLIGNVGSILSNLESVEGQGFSMVSENAPGSYELSGSVQDAWANRALQAQNLTVAPGITNGLAGVTRAYHAGLPFNNATNSSARDWLRNNAGIDIGGIETDSEEVSPPSGFDRALSGLGRAARSFLPGVFGVASRAAENIPGGSALMDNLTPFSRGSDVSAVRRIIGAVGGVVGDRTQRRIEAVGIPQFLYENTIDRLNPARSDSLSRVLLRNANPTTLMGRGFRNFTGLTLEDGQIRHGWDTPTEFRSQLPVFDTENTFGGIPLAVPGDIAGGDGGFLEDLAARSPEFRNLMRSLSPAINEAGIVGFAPQHGQFGDFGSAGSLSALLWLANMPEGVISGALYDTIDLIRYFTYDTAVGRLLGRVNPIMDMAPSANASRPDILSPFFGRDLGFNQQWTEEKYMSVRGSPALSWIPRPGQTYLGFILDAANGFASDSLFVDPVWNAMTGARRKAREAARVIPGRPVDPSVAEVSRFAPDIPNFSNRADANAFADILDVRINRVRARMNANPDDAEFIGRMAASINVMESQRNAIRNLDFNNVAQVVQQAVPTSPRGVVPRSSMDVAVALSRPASEPGDLLNLNRAVRAIDIARRGGTEVSSNVVRALARLGVATSSVAPSARLLVNDPMRFVPVHDVVKREAAVLLAELTPTMVPRSAVFARIASINQQLGALGSQVDDITLQAAHAASRANLIAEQRALSSLMDADEFALYATDLITAADELGNVTVAPAGYLLENAPDEILDSILPQVQWRFVSPRSTESVPESVVSLAVRDLDISGTEFLRTRRSNEELSQLAQLWGLDSPMNTPVDARSELSNVYRIEALNRLYPNLLSRYGSPIPNFLLDSPGARIVTRDRGLLGEPAESVLSSSMRRIPQALTEPTSQELRRARTLVNQFSRRGERTARRIAQFRDELNENPTEEIRQSIEREYARFQNIQGELDNVYARFPDLAVQDVARSLPEHLAPVGRDTMALAPAYVLSLRTFYSENALLQRMLHELAVTDELLRDLGSNMLLQPPLERVDPINEFQTTRQYNDEFSLHSVSEHDLPDSTLLTPEVSIPGETGLGGRELRDLIVEQTGSTPDQAETAIFNGLMVGQFRREGLLYYRGEENLSMEELFNRADEILPTDANEPTSLTAFRQAREATQPLRDAEAGVPSIAQDASDAPALDEPGEVIPMRPEEGGDVITPARDANIIDMNRWRNAEETSSEVTALIDQISELDGRGISEALDEALELLDQDLPVPELEQALSEIVARYNVVEDVPAPAAPDVLMEDFLFDDSAGQYEVPENDLVDGAGDIVLYYENGRRMFGVRDAEGNLITGAGGERRIEPIVLGDGVEGVVVRQGDQAVKLMEYGEDLTEQEIEFAPIAGELGIGPRIDSIEPGRMVMEDLTAQGYTTLGEVSRTPENQNAIMASILDTMEKMHNAGIGHGDLHSRNIMVNPETFEVRFIDFSNATRSYIEKKHDFTNFSVLEFVGNNSQLDINALDTLLNNPRTSFDDVREFLGLPTGEEALQRGLAELDQLDNALQAAQRAAINRQGFHGTHAASLLPKTRVTSLTNELGMGLYITTNPNEAVLHSRAMTSQDAIIEGTIRPRFTEEGRVFEITLPPFDTFPETIRVQDSYNPGYGDGRLELPITNADWNVVDAGVMAGKKNENTVGSMLREVMEEALDEVLAKDAAETIRRRFSSWGRKHPYSEWHQYVRSQIIKEVGSDSQAIQYSLFKEIQDRLEMRNVDAIKFGNTYNIVNPYGFSVDRSLPDTAAIGGLAEKLAARAEVQKLAYSRNPTKTNEVAMQQAFHDLNTFQREQLAGAVQDQSKIAVEAVRDLMRREDTLLNVRRAEEADEIAKQIADKQREIDRIADALDNDLGPCI